MQKKKSDITRGLLSNTLSCHIVVLGHSSFHTLVLHMNVLHRLVLGHTLYIHVLSYESFHLSYMRALCQLVHCLHCVNWYIVCVVHRNRYVINEDITLLQYVRLASIEKNICARVCNKLWLYYVRILLYVLRVCVISRTLCGKSHDIRHSVV